MMDRHTAAFREEASELLGELENSLLDLEKNPANTDLVGRIFRAMHTIKGSGAMFGFDNIATLIHNVESAYDRIRNGRLGVTGELINLTLEACDQVRLMLADAGEAEDPQGRSATIAASFRKILNESEPAAGATSADPAPAPQASPAPEPAAEQTYRIRFRPAGHVFANGTNPILLLQELLDMGTGRIVAQTNAIPLLDEMDPEVCFVYWDIILTTACGLNAIRDVFIFIEDDCDLRIDVIGESGSGEAAGSRKKLGEILVERGDISTEELQKILAEQMRLGEILVKSELVDPGKIHSALAEQEHLEELHKKRDAERSASIRVPADKLDRLVNMVGELVTVQSRLSQIASEQNHPQIIRVAEDVERLVAELRDTTMSIRMLPIGTTFNKFKRLVHDLARDLGKEIRLVTEGADTELDKTVIERLNDPLVHLIRNSIDHGIESPEIREAQGKPRTGTIVLSAEHSGASVVIRIQDDGAGLDSEAIRARAVEQGLIHADAALTERELQALILQPGFSTAKKVTNVSGRGVGMDVVKRNIDALQGTIEIDSRRGSGTAMTLKLPLTLAIIDGLLVDIGDNTFVLPLSAVEECVEINRSEVAKTHGQNLAMIRGELVPYILLRDLFHVEGAPPLIEQIVTTQIDGRRVGFLVDQVIGQHQTVIKSLGRIYKNIDEISGATILGDGRVVLILDLPKLVEKAERARRAQDDNRRIA